MSSFWLVSSKGKTMCLPKQPNILMAKSQFVVLGNFWCVECKVPLSKTQSKTSKNLCVDCQENDPLSLGFSQGAVGCVFFLIPDCTTPYNQRPAWKFVSSKSVNNSPLVEAVAQRLTNLLLANSSWSGHLVSLSSVSYAAYMYPRAWDQLWSPFWFSLQLIGICSFFPDPKFES